MKESTLRLEPEWVEFQIADGVYEHGDRGSGYHLEDDVTIEDGIAQAAFSLTGRVIWSQPYLEDQVANGTKIVIKGAGFVPYSRKLATSDLAPTTLVPKDTVGDVLAGNAEIKGLFGKPVFNHPKPTTLLKYLIRSATSADKDALVLDFFAGSSSTAHAVLGLNAEDGGRRKFMMVQLPEPTPEDSVARQEGYLTISDVSRERIRLAAQQIAGQNTPLDLGGQWDIGFRSFSLVDTNFSKWKQSSDVDLSDLEQHMLDLRESSSTDDASPDDLLAEILLKQGYSLTENISPTEIAGLDLRSVLQPGGDVAVLAYMDEHVKPTLEQLRAIVDADPSRMILLEDAFQGDDELKTNLVQLAKSKNIELWTA
ncbi:DNA methyltransferase [Salinibacterium sp. dk5596]|nr:DNA methyltransferase [Salinibacterium sp. dk5596]